MSDTVFVTIDRLSHLYEHAKTIGTLDAFSAVALQWARGADAELERLRAELERERMRLAACGVVAMANTEESAKEQRQIHEDYRSDSLNCVIRSVDEEMKLRTENAELRAKLETVAQMCEREYGCEQLAPEIRELLK